MRLSRENGRHARFAGCVVNLMSRRGRLRARPKGSDCRHLKAPRRVPGLTLTDHSTLAAIRRNSTESRRSVESILWQVDAQTLAVTLRIDKLRPITVSES
jgi:hypothetical protein